MFLSSREANVLLVQIIKILSLQFVGFILQKHTYITKKYKHFIDILKSSLGESEY